MTFPLEDQFIPEEFEDELDEDLIGDPGPDTEGVSKAHEEAVRAHRQVVAYKSSVIQLRAALRDDNPESKAARARLRKALEANEKRMEAARKRRDSAQVREAGASGRFGEQLEGGERDAFEALKSLFGSFGLGTLAPKIFEYVQEGYQADTIALLLQDTPEYKERFSANEARRKAGLAVLAPAEYLSVEAAYRQVLEQAGMPVGFYDNAADFRQWIAGDVAPTEIKSRVDMAVAATSQASPSYRVALKDMYGIGDRELAAYFLDRKKAEPILKKQAAAAFIGAAAIRRGFGASAQRMENLAALGVSAEEAEEGYARISQGLESMLGIAGRFGSQWSLEAEENATFGVSGEKEQKRLHSAERALFAGSPTQSAQRGLSRGTYQTS